MNKYICIKPLFDIKLGDIVEVKAHSTILLSWVVEAAISDNLTFYFTVDLGTLSAHFKSFENGSESVPATLICNHTWKNYEGFTERYQYCEKCDEKKV